MDIERRKRPLENERIEEEIAKLKAKFKRRASRKTIRCWESIYATRVEPENKINKDEPNHSYVGEHRDSNIAEPTCHSDQPRLNSKLRHEMVMSNTAKTEKPCTYYENLEPRKPSEPEDNHNNNDPNNENDDDDDAHDDNDDNDDNNDDENRVDSDDDNDGW